MHDQPAPEAPGPHPLSQIRGEFIWDGKYDEYGVRRRPEPEQYVRTLVEVERVGTWDTPRCGQLIHGDNLEVMSTLLERYRGAIDLIYLDPPFDVGSDFSMRVATQSPDVQAPVDVHAYSDQWSMGPDSYARVLHDRLVIARELLSEQGSIYVHCDWHANWIVRAVLNDVFGSDGFRNEIAWCYASPGRNGTRFKPCHDTIYFFSKGSTPIWNRPQQPLADATLNVQRLRFAGQDREWVRNRTTKDMVDWWDLTFHTGSSERTGYPTQKPLELMRRIIEASSAPTSLVADFYGGSGSFAVAAQQTGRSWITCDVGSVGVHVARKRLIDACTTGDGFVMLQTDTAGGGTAQHVGVQADVIPTDSGTALRVEIVDYQPAAAHDDGQNHTAGVSSGCDVIDAWSVSMSADDEPFHAQWHASRTRRTRDLQTRVELPITTSDPTSIAVKVVDIYGSATVVRVPVGVVSGVS